jgi:hypothetical protein
MRLFPKPLSLLPLSVLFLQRNYHLLVHTLPNLIELLLPLDILLHPLVGILIQRITINIQISPQSHRPLRQNILALIHTIHDARSVIARSSGIAADGDGELLPGIEEEAGIGAQVGRGREGLHGRLTHVNAADDATGELIAVERLVELQLDPVGCELDVGGAQEDVIDVLLGGVAVEVERHEAGWIGTVAVVGNQRPILDHPLDRCHYILHDDAAGPDVNLSDRKWSGIGKCLRFLACN